MVTTMIENKIVRDDENKIKKAFQVIDVEKKGYLEPEKLAGLLTTLGEPFSQEEIEEMFSFAVDPERGVIICDSYAAILAND